MRTLIISLFMFVFGITIAYAQVPQSFSFQGLVRNSITGHIYTSAPQITVKFTIRDGSAVGPPVYEEKFEAMFGTTSLGTFHTKVGTGVPISGVFTNIDWSSEKWLHIEIDPMGNVPGNFTIIDDAQILTAPYSFYADSTGQKYQIRDLTDVDLTGLQNNQVLVWNSISQSWETGNLQQYFAGVGIIISGSMIDADNGTAIWNADKLQGVNVAITPPSNQQVLQYNSTSSSWEPSTLNLAPYTSGTGINIGGTLISAQNATAIWNANQLQGVGVAATVPTNGLILKYNNTSGNYELSPDDNTTYNAGTGITIDTGNNIINTSPDQTVVITGSSGVNVTGSYPNFIISSSGGASINDIDNDTKIQVEKSIDEDIIRFDISGTEYFTMKDGKLEVLNTGNSVFIGENAGVNDDLSGNENVFIGFQAGMMNTVGTGNVALGCNSLRDNQTGFRNTALGYYALMRNTIGEDNTAVGMAALEFNTTGNGNTAVGHVAMLSNTTGAFNVAVGQKAMSFNNIGQKNTAVGAFALELNSSGNKNTSLGYMALGYNTTGLGNTALGYNCLSFNQTGQYNIAIGYEALKDNTSENFNIAIGGGALSRHTSGFSNVAIGPGAMNNHRSGNLNTAIGNIALINNTTGVGNTSIGNFTLQGVTTGSHNTALGNLADGTLASAINSTAIGYQAQFTASNQVRIGNSSVTSIGGYTNWTNVSDARFKENITENVSGLEFIMKLRPVTYNLNMDAIVTFLGKIENSSLLSSEEEKASILQTGFIAQEVEKAAQEIGYDFSGIDLPKNEKDYYGLRYSEFVVPLVKAVQEQQEIIQNQEYLINNYIIRLERLEAMLFQSSSTSIDE